MLTHDDLIVGDEIDRYRSITDYIRDRRIGGELKYTGRGAITIPNGSYTEIFNGLTDGVAHAKYVLGVAKLADNIVNNYKAIALEMLSSGRTKIEYKANGFVVPMYASYMNVSFAESAVEREYHDVLKPYEEMSGYYTMKDPYVPSFSGALADAYSYARSQAIRRTMDQSERVFMNLGTRIRNLSLDNMIAISNTANLIRGGVKLTLDEVRNARVQVLRQQATDVDNKRMAAMSESRENFTKYWSGMKQAMSARVDYAKVREDWATIPILPAGSESSRTWGIEVETVRADLVRRPAGWESKYDGSLESVGADDSCDCDCGDCYDGYHDDCGSSDDGCMEFVSPVLRSFNSNGLRDLCGPLENVYTNSSPGIHVHVGADNLSVFDIARLLRAYSIVSPFINGIDHRETRSYCKETSSDNVAYWLSLVRKAQRGVLVHPYDERHQVSPSDVVALTQGQPDDRYRDVNLQALSAHGTIEFRTMGPIYNYEHLVRWAWFCREMVNVSQLDLPVSVWTSVRSMADVIGILRQYGSEIPSDTHDKATVKLASQLNAGSLADVDA